MGIEYRVLSIKYRKYRDGIDDTWYFSCQMSLIPNTWKVRVPTIPTCSSCISNLRSPRIFGTITWELLYTPCHISSVTPWHSDKKNWSVSCAVANFWRCSISLLLISYWVLCNYTRNYSLTSTVLMAAVVSSIIVLIAGAIPTQGFSEWNVLWQR